MSLFQSLYEGIHEGFNNIIASRIHGQELENMEVGSSKFNLTKAKYHRNLKQHYSGLARLHASNGQTDEALKHSKIADFHAKREKHFSSLV